MGHFRYIKIPLDSEAYRAQTEEMNKNGHSISFACVLHASLPCWIFYYRKWSTDYKPDALSKF